MSEATARFRLPFIMPGQAQKEVYHNEALAMVDAALHACVEGPPINDPPAEPLEGQCWIVGPDPLGEWAGKQDQIACFSSGGWRFLEPRPGMFLWSMEDGFHYQWDGSWKGGEVSAARFVVNGIQVVGEQLSTIANPSGGTIIDQEARAAVGSLIAALKSHGLIG